MEFDQNAHRETLTLSGTMSGVNTVPAAIPGTQPLPQHINNGQEQHMHVKMENGNHYYNDVQ